MKLLLGPIYLGGRAFRGPNTTYLVKEIDSCLATESVRQSGLPQCWDIRGSLVEWRLNGVGLGWLEGLCPSSFDCSRVTYLN